MDRMKLEMVLKAIDEATAPLRKVRAELGGVNDGAKNATSSFDKLARSAEKLDQVGKKIAMAGAGMTALGLGAAHITGLTDVPEQAARIEHSLRALGNVGELGAAQLALMRDELNQISRDTNQTTEELIRGQQTLVAAGMKPQEAIRMLGVIGKAATAEQAEVIDLANAAYTVGDRLKIPVDGLSKALDTMTLSGKRGRFELKDMAREFPIVASGAAALGMQGQNAVSQLGAALQISMKGTGNTAIAANDLYNLLSKITAPEVVKNFEKLGVNILKVKNEAIAKGNDPFEAVIAATEKATKGNMDKLGVIFTDMQMRRFVQNLILGMDEYRQIRDETATADGVIQKDYANMMTTTTEKLKALKINLATTVLPHLAPILEKVNDILSRINNSAGGTKALLYGIGGLIVGGLGLTALGGTAMMFNSIMQSVVWIKGAAPILKTGWSAIAPLFGRVGTAARAFMFMGGSVSIPLVAAALLIYKYWKPLVNYLKGWFSGFMDAMRPLKPVISEVVAPFKALWGVIKSLLQPVEATNKSFEIGRKVGYAFGAAIGSIIAVVRGGSKILKWFMTLPMEFLAATKAFKDSGMKIPEAIWEGIKATAYKPIEAVKEMASTIMGYWPNSPAKHGPLKNIQRIKLSESIAEMIKPEPVTNAMEKVTGAVMGVGGGTAAGGRSGGDIVLHFSPNITLQGTATEKDRESFLTMLRTYAPELLKMLKDGMVREGRLGYSS